MAKIGWNVESANKLYNIDKWGVGYFFVDNEGFMVCSPHKNKKQTIRILDVIKEAKESYDLDTPLQIRFQDLLKHRVVSLNEAFHKAIGEYNYKSKYMGVFPIKVNQLREVVEEIITSGTKYNIGIEVGSKPELLAAMSLHTNYESLIICNGYKDCQYIRHALNGRKLGKKIIIVAEKIEEIKSIIDVAKELNVVPLIGLRVKLASKSMGKWATSSGENAKFGLSTVDILNAIQLLKEENYFDSLKLIHFHIGSQIPDIRVITTSVREAARFYAKLIKIGCSIDYIDVGGGLGVDYDGSRTIFPSSANYSLREYANSIVFGVMDVCNEEKVKHPIIVTESGRALVAHHSLIVVEVFGKIEKINKLKDIKINEDSNKLVKEIYEIRQSLSNERIEEYLHDLEYLKKQAKTLFDLGYLDLQSKAIIESLYWDIAFEICKKYNDCDYIPDEIKELQNSLSDQYLLNFSVFQSIPDNWALGQLFPIVPIHRLLEKPNYKATFGDITCDSDGKVNKFIDLQDVKDAISLHNINGEPYYIGFFITGAYQDTLGDLHNLFGRVNEVHIFLDSDEEKGWYIEETIKGSTISEVLNVKQYSTEDLVRGMKKQIDFAIKSDIVKPSEGMKLLSEYEKALDDYTYLKIKSK